MPDCSASGVRPEETAHAGAVYDFEVCVHTGWESAIVVHGELDLASVARFETVCASIDLSSTVRVVLDLRDLAFMDVNGLRAVLKLHALCLERSVALLIRPGPRVVQKMFEITGASCLLPFE